MYAAAPVISMPAVHTYAPTGPAISTAPVLGAPAPLTYAAPMTYQQAYPTPVTYAAPAPVTYAAPATTFVAPQTGGQYPVTTYAPQTAPQSGVSAPVAMIGAGAFPTAVDARLLQNGHVIHEAPVTREDLIKQGRIIEDQQREHALIQQAQAMPGAMANAHAVLTNVYAHADADAQQLEGAHAQEVHPQGQTLEVSILEAHGLKHLNMTGDSMSVSASVPSRGMLHHTPKIETQQHVKGTLDPVWNELHDLEGWIPGEAVIFTVKDYGMVGSKTEGEATLNSEDFYPQGFEGALALQGLPDAQLIVRVVPVPPQ